MRAWHTKLCVPYRRRQMEPLCAAPFRSCLTSLTLQVSIHPLTRSYSHSHSHPETNSRGPTCSSRNIVFETMGGVRVFSKGTTLTLANDLHLIGVATWVINTALMALIVCKCILYISLYRLDKKCWGFYWHIWKWQHKTLATPAAFQSSLPISQMCLFVFLTYMQS